MKGDFSRNTFDKKKHFTSVRMQQGRVQLDADWNEQMDIIDNRIRVGNEDFIGGSGAPSGNPGYKITPTTTDLTIGKGRFYVQGILIEKDKDENFTQQTDFPKAILPATNGLYLAYLDVWQQGVSAIDDTSIEEPALNGADTTTRIKNVAQVKLLALPNSQFTGTTLKCKDVIDNDTKNKPAWTTATAKSTGKLSATVSPNANLKNQLYRIEIHNGGNQSTTTFKWSRDNGALVASVSKIEGDIITLTSLRNQASLQFKANQWIELNNQERELQNKSGIFIQITKVNNNTITVTNWPTSLDSIQKTPAALASEFSSKSTIRRWDTNIATLAGKSDFTLMDKTKTTRDTSNQIQITLASGAVLPAGLVVGQFIELSNQSLLTANKEGYFIKVKSISGTTITTVSSLANVSDDQLKSFDRLRVVKPGILSTNQSLSIPLENGLSVTFTTGTYKTGDYWLIPTRAETNNIASAQYDFKTPQLPEGIVHYHAQLALIRKTSTTWELAGDCRNLISALGNKAYQSEPGDNEGSVFVDKTGNVTVKKQLNVKGVTVIGDTKTTSLTASGKTTTNSLQINGSKTNDVIVAAGIWQQQQKLQASDKQANDLFGHSVAISGNRAIVGAHHQDTGGTDAGAAYVFYWNGTTWIQQAKLQASDKQANDRFGVSVAISGDRAIVGADQEDTGGDNAGAAYVFYWNGTAWIQQTKLQASDKQANDRFGVSVAISGDRAIVGARSEDTGGTDAGAAYVFHWNGTQWTQQQKLQANDKRANDFFGFSVAISGDRAIVGAYLQDTGGNSTGSAYVFHWNGTQWIQQQKLQAGDKQANDQFGISVAINSNRAIVGAYREDTGGTDAGAAYVFHWNGTQWIQQQKLQASDKQTNDRFGTSVAINGNRAIVGADLEDTGGTDAGAAYVFYWNGTQWIQQQKLQASDKTAYDYFGVSVAISGDRAIVGAYYEDTGANAAGSAYSWTLQNNLGIGTNNPKNKLDVIGNTALRGNVTITGATKTASLTTTGSLQVNGSSNNQNDAIIATQIWQQQQKLQADDKQAHDLFGHVVAISGDRAIVAAYGEDTGGTDAGAAYVFHWKNNKWQLQQKLQASDKQAEDHFGFSVAISGDRAIVGARNEDTGGANAGSAYVFHWNGTQWIQQQKLQASDKQANDLFGLSVAISGNRAIIGASTEDTGGTNAGAAYIFYWNGTTWIQQQKLQASDKEAGDHFGHSVAINGDRAIIGASTEDTGGDSAGAAYVFYWNDTAWIQQAKLQASDKQTNDRFGTSVAISSNRAIVGAYREDTGGTDAGAAYVFHWNGTTWIQQQKLQANDKQTGDLFGYSVAISSNRAIVGAYLEDPTGTTGAGSAYVFHWNGTQWIQQQKLLASDKQANDQFGVSVAISGNRAIVGADNKNTGGILAGAAYVWTLQNSLGIGTNNPKNNLDVIGSTALQGNVTVAGATTLQKSAAVTGSLQVNGSSNNQNDAIIATQIWQQQQKLQADDKQAYDLFGHDVAISGDRAIVAAYGEDTGGADAGAAYVFHWKDNKWQLQQKLQASDKQAEDHFGFSVAISGDRAIVGARNEDTGGANAGSAYVFHWNGTQWIQQAKLLASDKQAGDHFGLSIAISGNRAIIGAYAEDTGGTNVGAAYIFHWNGTQWIQQQKLQANDKAASDHFGYSVAISSDRAIVGAYLEDTGGNAAGSAYVFHWNGTQWIQQQKLLASDKQADDHFGISVAISGDQAIVGAYREDTGGTDAGAAYVFHWNGTQWTQQQKLQANDKQAGDVFGYSVAISSNRAIVGAYLEDPTSITNAGSAYIFHWNGTQWIQQQKLLASDKQANDHLGLSVAISGNRAIVGAHNEDTGGISTGAAYVWTLQNSLGVGTNNPKNNLDVIGSTALQGNVTVTGATKTASLTTTGSLQINGSSDSQTDAIIATQVWRQQQKLQTNDKQAGDHFGYSAAISGNRAIVGAYREDTGGDNAGAAYIFHWNGTQWIQQPKLQASDKQASDNFGVSVAINGDRAIVGAASEDTGGTNVGAAYIFHWNGTQWVQQQKLQANDKQADDHFGNSVAISGNQAIIGASLEDTGGDSAGAAYVFHWNGTQWIQQQKLQASDKAANDVFGYSVAINSNRAIVGARGDNTVGNMTGAAYVFHWNGTTWIQQAKLQACDKQADDYFGVSVAISDDRAIVGAYREDAGGTNAGAAYVFHWNGTQWIQQQKLLASDKQTNDQFGFSVAISGDRAIVGADLEDTGGTDAGAAYVFYWNGTTWIQQQKLQAIDKAERDIFGYSVGISGNRVIVGAYNKKSDGSLTGAAYLWTLQNSLGIGTNSPKNNLDVIGSTALQGNVTVTGATKTASLTTTGSLQVNGSSNNQNDAIIATQVWQQQQKLQASDKQANDLFGHSVAISGNRAIVGAHHQDTGGTDAGAAYVFYWNGTTWIQQAKLQASDKQANDRFGVSVAISGDRAIVGADQEDTGGDNAGAAYVFYWNGTDWIQQTKLQASDKQANDRFGVSVAISGDRAIVGARSEDTGGTDAGAAYIFHWNGTQWTQQQKLQANDKRANDFFGISVAISGDRAIVGAYLQDTGGNSTGSAYVFHWNGTQWIQQQKLQAGDKQANDQFGISVAINSNRAIVGAYREDTGGTDAGAAYVFHWNGTQWIQQQKLQASDKQTNDRFGTSVAINGNRAIVGADLEDTGGTDAGAAYVFYWNGTIWIQQQKLQASDKTAYDYFGVSVAISGDRAIVGAYYEDTGANAAGSAYLWTLQNSLGIGTNTPQNRLEVTGNTSTPTIVAKNDGTGYAFYAPKGKIYAVNGVGAFTGVHEAIITSTALENIKQGMLLSVTGKIETHLLTTGKKALSSTLSTVNLSSVAQDTKVIGVFSNIETPMDDYWYTLKETEKLIAFNALGDGLAWVSNINGDIKAGDYITTSQLPGYGMKQKDGLLHNYTLGKALEDVSWSKVTETTTLNGKSYKVYLIGIVYTSG